MVKAVSFNETVNVSYDDSLSLCQRKQFWYNVNEFRAIRRENHNQARLMVKERSLFGTKNRRLFLSGQTNDNKNKRQQQTCCFRGLERACPTRAKERAQQIRSFVRVVLDEYATLRDMGLSYKTSSLTKISSSCSKRDVKYALKMAKMDALEAIDTTASCTTRTTNVRGSSSPLRRRHFGFPPPSSTLFSINKRKNTNDRQSHHNKNNLRTDKVVPLVVTATKTATTRTTNPTSSHKISNSTGIPMPLQSTGMTTNGLVCPSA